MNANTVVGEHRAHRVQSRPAVGRTVRGTRVRPRPGRAGRGRAPVGSLLLESRHVAMPDLGGITPFATGPAHCTDGPVEIRTLTTDEWGAPRLRFASLATHRTRSPRRRAGGHPPEGGSSGPGRRRSRSSTAPRRHRGLAPPTVDDTELVGMWVHRHRGTGIAIGLVEHVVARRRRACATRPPPQRAAGRCTARPASSPTAPTRRRRSPHAPRRGAQTAHEHRTRPAVHRDGDTRRSVLPARHADRHAHHRGGAVLRLRGRAPQRPRQGERRRRLAHPVAGPARARSTCAR